MNKVMLKFSSVSLMAFSALCVVPACVGPESGDHQVGWADAKDGDAVTLSGTVEMTSTMHENHDVSSAEGQQDPSAHSCELEYYLHRGPQDRAPLRLHFNGETPAIQTGDEISVTGIWHIDDGGPSLAVEDVLSTAKPAEGEFGQSNQGIVTVRAPKKNKIAVFLLGNTNTTAAEAKAMIDAYSPGSAAAFVGENSGLVDTFEGDVFSYPNFNITDCDENVIRVDVLEKFENEGQKVKDYTNFAYVLPKGVCKFYASGTVGAPGGSSKGHTYFNDNFATCDVVAHELGHNLGFAHSGATDCGDDALYKPSRVGCVSREYGNVFDAMGGGGASCTARGHYSIMHKRYAGYLSKCEDVTAGGTAIFRLSAAEGSCGMRSLRIPIAGENNYYYLEFRKPGAGEFAAKNSRVLLQVSDDPQSGTVDKINPRPYLLDANPATYTPYDSGLVVGTTYDLPGNVSIQVLSIADIARIKVTMPAGAGAKCRGGATPPSDGTEIGGLCGKVDDMFKQAEQNTYQKNCTKSSSQPDYKGTGYMDFGGAGSVVEMGNIETPRYGSYKLTFRYANGTATDKTCKITVNGQPAGTLAFGSTGGWSAWKTTTINATLKKGINKIRVTSIADGPNLDQVLISAN